jgi:hypothetical protein
MTVNTTINENLYSYSSVAIPPNSPNHNRYAILDSGATGTFVTTSDAPHLSDISVVNDGPTILSASGNSMPTTLRGQLPLSDKLSVSAQAAFVLDDLKTGTLISLAQLCDDDCIAVFTRYDVKILKNNEVLITGKRMPNGLWTLPFANSHDAPCTDTAPSPLLHIYRPNPVILYVICSFYYPFVLIFHWKM